jgi:CheY-like chemotaxis protein
VDSGAAALAELKRATAAGEPYALLLLDVMMPEMDGYTLVRQIQQHPELAGAPVMMLSSSEGGAPRDRNLPIAACLMKPIKQSELFDAIVTALAASLRGDESPADGQAAAGAAHTAQIPQAVPPGRQRLRILLAEDNAVNQKLAIRLLEKRGHTVVVAGHGKEALAALERERFDAVLMDVQMPEMDGFEATAAIRARERSTGERVPIVAMTAHAMKGDRERCLAMGMDGYVSKPLQSRELFDVVESLVPAPPRDGPGMEGRPSGKPFDLTAALERTAGDRELLRELAAVFCESCSPMLAEVGSALEQGDAHKVMAAAHALKGAVGAFGTSPAFNAALELETMGRQGNLTGSDRVYGELRAEIERLEPALNELAHGEGI